ncbi:MAG: hypothetical protein U1F32_12945 [Roseateles sp.]
MRQVGQRQPGAPALAPSAEAMEQGFALSAGVALFTGGRGFFPKGVFRYKSHEEANRHEAECLAACMARLARERQRL